MKHKKYSVLSAVVLAMGLVMGLGVTGCSTTDVGSDSNSALSPSPASGTPGTPVTPATQTAATGATANMGATASGTGTSEGTGSMADTGQASSAEQTSASPSTSSLGAPNSTVARIEVIPRASDTARTETGSTAGSAVGGTGSGATGSGVSDRVYRITLQMDDGTTRIVTQETAPAFSTGDRVRTANESVQR